MRIAVIGACGRMGLLIVERLKREQDMEIVSQIDIQRCNKYVEDIELLKEKGIDVVVDFSMPQVSLKYIPYINFIKRNRNE